MDTMSAGERAGITPEDIPDMISMHFDDRNISVTGPVTERRYNAAEEAIKALGLADGRELTLINDVYSLMSAAADEAFLSGVRAGIQMLNAIRAI